MGCSPVVSDLSVTGESQSQPSDCITWLISLQLQVRVGWRWTGGHGQVRDAQPDGGGPQAGAAPLRARCAGVPGADPTTRAFLLGSSSQASGPDRQTLGQLPPGDAVPSGQSANSAKSLLQCYVLSLGWTLWFKANFNMTQMIYDGFKFQDALKLVRRDRSGLTSSQSNVRVPIPVQPNFKEMGNGVTMI